MRPDDMEQNLMMIQQEMKPMLGEFMDAARNRIAGTATQQYMQDGGFVTPPFPPRKSVSGPLRKLSGRLARSLTNAQTFSGGVGGGRENISKLKVTKTGVKMVFGSNVPYARAHEEGVNENVQVDAHWRTIDQAFGEPIPARSVRVKQHTRHMMIPARPYLGPSLDDNLQALDDKLSQDFQDMILEVIDGK